MTEKQKRFADFYVESLNATESAVRAGYSKRSAYAIASRLMRNAKVKEFIDVRLCEKESLRIAGQNEILEYLTGVIRSVDPECPLAAKLRACELLGRRYGMFDGNCNLNFPAIQIIDDISLIG